MHVATSPFHQKEEKWGNTQIPAKPTVSTNEGSH
ncbi:hypothetical protein CA11_43580 [Gimesia maris]|nr:hypothetical protein CA11_43580 [Gimesia maris]